MPKSLSVKFRWLSLVATWGVVCIHSNIVRWAPAASDWVNDMQSTLSIVLGFAVPLFFVISGYMFVCSYEKHGWKELVQRKVRALYVPMLCWCLISVAACLPISIYAHTHLPTVGEIVRLPLMIFCEKTIHFWYVRALLALAVLAPLVLFLSRHLPLLLVAMASTAFIAPGSRFALFHIPVIVFYFFAGCLLYRLECRYGSVPVCRNRLASGALALGSFRLLLFLVRFCGSSYYVQTYGVPILVIGMLWCLYDVVDSAIGAFPDALAVLFPVYCFHIVTLCWIGGLLKLLFGTGQLTRFVCYLILCMTFWLDVLMANVLRRRLPRVYNVLSGGR